VTGGGVPTAAEAAARRSSCWRGASRRGGWPSSSLIATAGGGEAFGVVGLDGEGAEVGVQRRQELTGEEGNDGKVVPVEVRPREVASEHQ
jgi:hypothetical protein